MFLLSFNHKTIAIMPYLQTPSVKLYYEEMGAGPETIVFSHGLLWSHKMFRAQMEYFSDRYRVIAYDHRGQGQSEVTKNGYDMDTLTHDALAVLNELGVERCHFAGLSMGGFVAMRMAIRHPERMQSLILLETSAQAEPQENVPRYRMLNTMVRLFGAGAVKGPVMKIMFGQSFLQDEDRRDLRQKWARELTANKRSITRAVKGVIDRDAVSADQLATIHCPTLIVVGEEDVATVPEKSEYMAEHIPGARLVRIPRAGHTSTVEEPQQVNQALDQFLP